MSKFKLIVRDDDISFFTSATWLKEIYTPLWQRGKKVCLSVIPTLFAIEGMNTYGRPENARFNAREKRLVKKYDLGDNATLCWFLNSLARKGLVEIILHGVTHQYNEFNTDYDNAVRLLNAGRKMLKQWLPDAKINTFVAPYDFLSVDATRAVLDSKLNLCVPAKLFEKKIMPELSTRPVLVHSSTFCRIYALHSQKVITSDHFFYYESLGAKESLKFFNSLVTESLNNSSKILVCKNHYWQFFGQDTDVKNIWQTFIRSLLKYPDIDIVSFTQVLRGFEKERQV